MKTPAGPVGAYGEDLDTNCDGADGVVIIQKAHEPGWDVAEREAYKSQLGCSIPNS